MVSESEVIISIDNGVLTITLNRPKARNAANKAVAEGVSAAIDQLESLASQSTRSLVLP